MCSVPLRSPGACAQGCYFAATSLLTVLTVALIRKSPPTARSGDDENTILPGQNAM
ncbi:hypothetical protein AS9A_0727 [Hoyosella subflava DQS3-9A1]|uniref:Uncharacterized protein n=1 Tax=Hoyosella subflava (strain DSM 45089 / JCM 17490 / NBRC 109087 / DQS3-9A1) TaxID=443218 RepID=F6EL89_HOYSD|nr:hypothetical protein AS9A_0727 [Hoyosella subflava DQS3-9A1]